MITTYSVILCKYCPINWKLFITKYQEYNFSMYTIQNLHNHIQLISLENTPIIQIIKWHCNMIGLRITKSWICSVIQRRFKEGIWYKKLFHRKCYKIPAIPAILLAAWQLMRVVCRQQTRWHWQRWTPDACHMLHLTSLPPEGLAASTTNGWYMKHSWVRTQVSWEVYVNKPSVLYSIK